MFGWIIGGLLALGLAGCTGAVGPTATMHKIDASGVGDAVGTVTISSTSSGTVFAIDLKGLPPRADA
jgi:Cu/Zn superoxide dismutase